MKAARWLATGMVWFVISAASAGAQTGGPWSLTWSTVDGGGAMSLSGGAYLLLGDTSGQPDAGRLAGSTYELRGGFWHQQGVVVGAPDPLEGPPIRFRVFPARPNPTREATVVVFDLPSTRRATVEVFGVSGSRIRTLLDAERPPGRHQVWWNGNDTAGHMVGRGIYLVRVRAGTDVAVTKVVWTN